MRAHAIEGRTFWSVLRHAFADRGSEYDVICEKYLPEAKAKRLSTGCRRPSGSGLLALLGWPFPLYASASTPAEHESHPPVVGGAPGKPLRLTQVLPLTLPLKPGKADRTG